VLTEADIEYIRAGFVPLEELCDKHGEDTFAVRAQIESGRLPKPSYVLDDGTEMMPSDYFDLVDEAGGIDGLHDDFVARYTAAARAEPEPLLEAEDEWAAYLSGEYGVCLRTVMPENIARKSALAERVDRLLARPHLDDTDWGNSVRAAVDELDALERDFAPYDRIRFGGPVSHDRLVDGARKRYPDVFTAESSREGAG
jgi:uncharacterized protein DUF6058